MVKMIRLVLPDQINQVAVYQPLKKRFVGFGCVGLAEKFLTDSPHELQKYAIFVTELIFEYFTQSFCQGWAFARCRYRDDQSLALDN